MTHKLLIIDDHPETLDIVSRVLRQHSFYVLATTSALEGLSLVEKERPDLLLLDGMMPEMDGWELCRRVRGMPEIANTPIIMFSAVNEAEQKLAGFDAGADDYLTKPTEPLELLERVQSMLEGVPPREDISEADLEAAKQVIDSGQKRFGLGADIPNGESNLVAVVGVRGGVGTTLLALNLAVSMSLLGQDTVLLDLDIVQGHVALYLKQSAAKSVNALLALPANEVRAAVATQVLPYADNLGLLLAKQHLIENPTPVKSEIIYDIVDGLAIPGRTVVVDCGRGVSAVNRAVIEQADQIIVCIKPERLSLAIGRPFLTNLQDILFPDSQMHTVLMDFTGQISLPQSAVEQYLGQDLAAMISIRPQDLTHAVNKSVPLVKLAPEAKPALIIRQLAQQLVAAA